MPEPSTHHQAVGLFMATALSSLSRTMKRNHRRNMANLKSKTMTVHYLKNKEIVPQPLFGSSVTVFVQTPQPSLFFGDLF
jgi:hypothetical protein